MSKKCASCGFDNLDDASFCESCGSKIEAFVPPPAPAPVMAAHPSPASAQAPPSPQAPPEMASQGGGIKCAVCGAENLPGNEYCDSCGAKLSAAAPAPPAMAAAPVSRLVLPQGDEIRIDSYPRAFGRGDFARVNKSEYVSRKHFEVSMENGKYYLTDTGSTNGTTVNKQKVTTKVELKDGDSIELGGAITVTFKAG